MVGHLRERVDRFILTDAPSAPAERAWDLDEVARALREEAVEVDAVPEFDAALAHAQAVGETVLVTGSFHTVGDAMARLQVSPLPG